MESRSHEIGKCLDIGCLWFDVREKECFAGDSVWNYCVFRVHWVVERRKKSRPAGSNKTGTIEGFINNKG